MISLQSITLQDLQYSYCAAIFVVLMCDDEAKESLATAEAIVKSQPDLYQLLLFSRTGYYTNDSTCRVARAGV